MRAIPDDPKAFLFGGFAKQDAPDHRCLRKWSNRIAAALRPFVFLPVGWRNLYGDYLDYAIALAGGVSFVFHQVVISAQFAILP